MSFDTFDPTRPAGVTAVAARDGLAPLALIARTPASRPARDAPRSLPAVFRLHRRPR